jgi:aryl-alcohol dehydrogenase-like predicted oxidoreductase
VASGKAVYWGTSEWPAGDVREAVDVADRYRLRRPVVEQPEYNLFTRARVEREYADLVADLGLGLMTWSPLASGLLTGKYRDGVPDGSRATLANYAWLRERLTDRGRNRQVAALGEVASELGCSVAQLSLAWCLAHPSVSTVIIGASGPDQVRHNVGSLELLPRMQPELLARINALMS